ncbi:MAG: DUF5591 domain-containing protein [Thermoplasmata archaeon]
MGRTIDHLAGLAVLGVGTAGPLSFSLPDLLIADTAATGEPAAGTPFTRVSSEPAGPPGQRRLRLTQGSASLRLAYPIPAAEVSGVSGAIDACAPGVWFVHGPLKAEEMDRLKAARPELVVLGNARDLFREGEPFVRAMHQLREGLGAAPILWAPRVALPHRLAYLVYVGVDLVDTTQGEIEAVEGVMHDATLGAIDPDPRRRRERCDCPSCRSDPVGPLARHVTWAYAEELRLVRAAATQGRLRELVEARLTAEPLLAELLRYTDRHLYPLLESRMAVVSNDRPTYVLAESFRRPEVRRFRDRFLERYRPPASKEVLLLVPCSRTKPYRASRSHRRFAHALENLPNLPKVHVVSVTSPLGLVPRELEDVYPARNYDIPVTGEWSESERAAVTDALAHLVARGGYREIVVHLDPTEYGFVDAVLPSDRPVRWTMMDDRSTSSAALARLAEVMASALASSTGAKALPPLRVVREELQAIAEFQFGADAAQRLFAEPTRLAGHPWFQRLTDGRSTDLATWRDQRGLFHLTVAGGRRLMPDPPLAVEVAEGVALAGDLFTPGVVRADPQIRIGDAVLLVRQGDLLAVGEAELPGAMMTQMPHGLAVHVRHRSRDPAGPRGIGVAASGSAAREGPVV